MRIENILHEEVGAGERVTPDALAGRAVECRNRRGIGHRRHMARLAGLLIVEVAVLPLEVRHLFGEAAGGLSRSVKRSGVKRVARSAECRLAKVIGLRKRKARSESVNRCRASLSRKRTEERARLLADCSNGKVAVIRFRRTEAFRISLVADRARNSVSGSCGSVMRRIQRHPRKNRSVLTSRFVHEVLQRHVARGALVLNRGSGRGVVDRLAADTGLPIRIASRVRHETGTPRRADRNVLALRRFQIVVAAIAAGRQGIRRLLREEVRVRRNRN